MKYITVINVNIAIYHHILKKKDEGHAQGWPSMATPETHLPAWMAEGGNVIRPSL